MDKNATRSLILRMLDSGKLLPETVEDLNDYLEELEQRPLDKMDTDYLQGLASRLGFAAGGAAPAPQRDDHEDEDDDVADDWAGDDHDDHDEEDESLAEATARIEALQTQLSAARTAVDKARNAFGEMKGSAGGHAAGDAENGDAENGDAAAGSADGGPTEALEAALNEAAGALAERG